MTDQATAEVSATNDFAQQPSAATHEPVENLLEKMTPMQIASIRAQVADFFTKSYQEFVNRVSSLHKPCELTIEALRYFDLGCVKFQEAIIKMEAKDFVLHPVSVQPTATPEAVETNSHSTGCEPLRDPVPAE